MDKSQSRGQSRPKKCRNRRQETRQSRQVRKCRCVDLEVKGSRKMGSWGMRKHIHQSLSR